MIIATALLLVIGFVFMVVGYRLWKKEQITLLHNYHYDKVEKNNKKAFCTMSGIGVIIIGIGISVTGVIVYITDSALSFIPFGIGFAVGLTLLIMAGRKYN